MSLPTCRFTSRIWISRIKKGIPRKKLARLLGHASTTQLSRWEGAKKLPNLHTALQLGAILEVPVDYLFTCDCVAHRRQQRHAGRNQAR